MIFKAIVTSEAKDNENRVYVTIPVLDGASSKNDFRGINQRLANICSLPGCIPKYAKGDIVYVDFEQDNMSDPIIIGSLMSSKSNNAVIDLYADSLTVDVNTQLSGETFIEDDQAIANQTTILPDSGGGSDVRYQNRIETIGILKGEGNGVVNSAEIDNEPIESSNNIISSGAVYDALSNTIIEINNRIDNTFSYGSTDLTPGVSHLDTGCIYFVYE